MEEFYELVKEAVRRVYAHRLPVQKPVVVRNPQPQTGAATQSPAPGHTVDAQTAPSEVNP
jgi:hypothetical protein